MKDQPKTDDEKKLPAIPQHLLDTFRVRLAASTHPILRGEQRAESRGREDHEKRKRRPRK